MNVVIVELAAKAKTINKYLGSGFKVIPSYGHVRDLPSKDGSVEPDKDFEMHWDVDGKSAKVMREIAAAVKNGRQTHPGHRPGSGRGSNILAHPPCSGGKTGPQEGRPRRARHIQCRHQASRAGRHEGPAADRDAAGRGLSGPPRARLSGRLYPVPVLWRKLPGARSAGRVQSVALRLVCDREAEIEAFRTDEYWTIEALLATAKGEDVRARLNAIAGTRLEKLDIKDGGLRQRDQGGDREGRLPRRIGREEGGAAQSVRAVHDLDAAAGGLAQARLLGARRRCRWPSACTKASTSAARRSASLPICEPTACRSCRRRIGAIRAPGGAGLRQALSAAVRPRVQDQGQERAGSARGDPSDRVSAHARGRRPRLERDQARLYELIWKRAVASQMAAAELEQTTADIDVQGRDGKAYGLQSHRLGRAVRRLPETLRGRPRRGRRGEPPAAAAGAGRPAQRQGHRGQAAFHRAAAALFGSHARQEDGGARHRPSFDLCLDARRAAGSRLCAHRQEAPDPRGQGPAGHRLPRKLLQALRRIRLHRRPRGEARSHLRPQARVEGRAARLLARLHRSGGRDQGPASRRGARSAQRAARAAHLSRQGRWQRSAARARAAALAACR